jgi:hypothetical protein
MQSDGNPLPELREAHALLNVLHQTADPVVADAIELLIRDAPDHKLCRINILDFASQAGLNEERVIAAFLHASRIGLFELSWNVRCPGCGGVLDPHATLKTVRRDNYACELCAAGYEVTLDEIVEVTFTVTARVRRIAAHSPETLSFYEYYRQMYWSSGVDLPDDFEAAMQEAILDSVELPPGEKAILSLPLSEARVVVFDPITHMAHFLDVKGKPTRERQNVSIIIKNIHAQTEPMRLHPGPARLSIENRTSVRVLPAAWIMGRAIHHMISKRKPFLTAKRLLSNQTFRELYGAEPIDIDQHFNISSLSFLFTDRKNSTALYERVGDLVAHSLVRMHFDTLTHIVASQAGAIVKTTGDAVMATFPTPDRAVAAALRMREAMDRLNQERNTEDLLLKIGIHEGPCLAVMENAHQDYFGRTVNSNRHERRAWPSRESPAIQPGISWSLEVTRWQMPCLMPGKKTGRIAGSN